MEQQPEQPLPTPSPYDRAPEERARIEQRLTVAKRFRAARVVAGMTLEQVADIADVTPQAISRLEQGDRDVYFSTIVAACDAVGLPIDWLVCGVPDVASPRMRRMFRA